MKVLVACEFSGIVRDAFRARGHEAVSCDLEPTQVPGPHHQGDVRELLHLDWDLMIAHPPCTHLAASGARWFRYKQAEQAAALEFVHLLWNAPIPKIALENPVGILSTHLRKPNQIIHPWQFGEPVTKATCLWLKGLRSLKPTQVVGRGKHVQYGSKRIPLWYANLKSSDRAKKRSITSAGIAAAMADQWSAQ